MSASFDTATSWNVDFIELDKLIDNMLQLPNESEEVINQTLRNGSADQTAKTIITGIPVSEVIARITSKRHAKDSNPMQVTYDNLGFMIRPKVVNKSKQQWSYLKYPDLGIGTSIGNKPREFMRKGMQEEGPKITDDLNAAMLEIINKRLGGK